jgi:outer membrane biosynthesis protein TonB
MNIKQANIILEKINRLYKSMTLDPSNIDEFEQELMLSYIRQLHDAFSVDGKPLKKSKAELPPVVNFPKQEHKPEPKPESKPEPKPELNPEPKSIRQEDNPEKSDEPKPKDARFEEQPAESIPNPAPSRKHEPATSTSGVSKEDLNELFDVKQAKELSEKLGESPISDLTKAMGLNEKIFTINELFGGDTKAFDLMLKTLNTFNSFEQAKSYLSENFAGQYDWTQKEKKKKAINLIKLIRRRYN